MLLARLAWPSKILSHVCPIVEDGPPGALDPTVMWRHEDLVQEWLQVVVGLHSYKSTIAAVRVAHDKVIDRPPTISAFGKDHVSLGFTLLPRSHTK